MGQKALLFALLVVLSNIATGGVDKTQEALTGQSLNLTISPDLPYNLRSVRWNLKNTSGTFRLADIEDNKLQSESNRLETFNNGTLLQIKHLTVEDSGSYYATITYQDNHMESHTFHINIYERILNPSIRTGYGTLTGECFNVTLHCSVPSNTSELSYSWRYRYGDNDYRPYNTTGDAITVSLPEFQNAEFICTVANSADQKNVSVRLTQCPQTANRHRYFLALTVIPVLLLIAACILCRNMEQIKYSVQETDNTESLAMMNREKHLQPSDDLGKPFKRPEFIEIHPPKQPDCHPVMESGTYEEYKGGNFQEYEGKADEYF